MAIKTTHRFMQQLWRRFPRGDIRRREDEIKATGQAEFIQNPMEPPIEIGNDRHLRTRSPDFPQHTLHFRKNLPRRTRRVVIEQIREARFEKIVRWIDPG